MTIRRRRRGDHTSGNHDRWLVSYADFITLLFAFFVTMYAISNVDARKLEKAVSAFQVAFSEWKVAPEAGVGMGILPGSSVGATATSDHPAQPDGALLNVESRLFYRMRAVGEDRVELRRDHRGLVITVKEAGSFATGSAELDANALELFREIGRSIADLPNSVRIEGHTDDLPIHTERFSSNWDLSTARATTVVAFLVQQVGLAPTRLSAAGYGEFHPREPNDSPEHRARNRRVDIVVLNAQTESREEPLVGLARRP
jgi:chemotaxis protein MotB